MSKPVKKTWLAMQDKLVFEITQREPGAAISVTIFWSETPGNIHVVKVHAGNESEFDVKVSPACYVYGSFKLRSKQQKACTTEIGVFANIHYGLTGQFAEQNFIGFIATFNIKDGKFDEQQFDECACDIDTEIDVGDGDAMSDLPLFSDRYGELFPYVYVHKWPLISGTQLQYRFIQFAAPTNSPPTDSFYTDLCNARTAGRTQMTALAQDFTDGVAPYQGQFIGNPDQLTGGAANLARVLPLVNELKTHPDTLIAELKTIFPPDVLAAPAYQEQLIQLWQSYFALLIEPDNAPMWLVQLTRLLTGAHMLDCLFGPNAKVPAVTATLMHDLAAASILLPNAIFPLPPANGPSPSPPSSERGWIAPYAIGDLQMVRQRLLRYVPGEIAYIENIMRGEKKEIGRKRLQRQTEIAKNESSHLNELENDAREERNDLLEETRKALAEKAVSNSYNNFTTTYGIPTEATLNGSWTELTREKPHRDDATRFAREILNKTVSKITHSVNTVRSSSTMNQTEETANSTIDNSSGERNLVCIFRWVNKVYEAHVVNYGTRLMVEFIFPDPAAILAHDRQKLQHDGLLPPPTPLSQGITSFRSITRENYAALAAIYDVTDIAPPAAPKATVSATLRSGEEKLVALPAGYCVSTVCVNTILTQAGATAPTVMVGCEIFSPGDCPAKSRVFGEDGNMPIAVSGATLSLSPPTDSDALVNVVIDCAPSDTAMDLWRIQTYSAIIAGYRKVCTDYAHLLSVRRGHGPTTSPQMRREIEARQIKRACIQLLFERRMALLGSPVNSPPRPNKLFWLGDPGLFRFFDDVFEWHEMTIRFFDGGVSSPLRQEEDSHFHDGDSPFLHADMAAVTVPAQPAHVLALLYFLSSGMIWEGPNHIAPVDSDSAAIVNKLKTAATKMELRGHCVGKPWKVVVPTSMQVIEDLATPFIFPVTTGEST